MHVSKWSSGMLPCKGKPTHLQKPSFGIFSIHWAYLTGFYTVSKAQRHMSARNVILIVRNRHKRQLANTSTKANRRKSTTYVVLPWLKEICCFALGFTQHRSWLLEIRLGIGLRTYVNRKCQSMSSRKSIQERDRHVCWHGGCVIPISTGVPSSVWILLRRRSGQASVTKDEFKPMACRRNYSKTLRPLIVKSMRLFWKKVPLKLQRWTSSTIFEIKISFDW